MNVNFIRFSLVGVVVLASAAAPLTVRQWAARRSASLDDALKQQAAQMDRLRLEKTRLCQLVQTRPQDQSASHEQLVELLKLRDEVGRLRRLAKVEPGLRAWNQHLLAAPTNWVQHPAQPPPDPSRVQAHWSKDQLTAVGYSDPRSALQSALAAMVHGDPRVIAAALAPEAIDRLAEEGWRERGNVAAEITNGVNSITTSLNVASGFSLVGQKQTAPDRTILDVYFEGEGVYRKALVTNVGGEWKFRALGFAGGKDEDFEGSFAWP